MNSAWSLMNRRWPLLVAGMIALGLVDGCADADHDKPVAERPVSKTEASRPASTVSAESPEKSSTLDKSAMPEADQKAAASGPKESAEAPPTVNSNVQGTEEQSLIQKTGDSMKPTAGAEPTPEPGSPRVLLGSPELTAGIPGSGPLSDEELRAWLDNPQNMQPFDIELPLGLSLGALQIKGLDKNPLTRAKIELGRQLYFDPRLSADATVSCASCHHPDSGWVAHTQFGVGIGGQTGNRNSPPSFNRILSDAQFWDGRAPSLEAQALGPIANPIEMGNTHSACLETLAKIPGYKLEFDKIFTEMTIEAVGAAIASFERAVVSGPSPHDYHERFVPLAKENADDLKADDPDLYAKYVEYKKACDDHPMSESALRGRDLFFGEKANCTACHVGPNFSDELYHNLGVGMEAETPDVGRESVTHNELDRGAFKTPTIRNVALTGPYMHDGSQKTLEEVVEWYAKGGHPNKWLDLKIKKLDLSDQDKKDLVEFMKSCTGDFPKVETDRLPK